jgi:queuine tRNA-ribosyltransferase
MIGFTVQKRSGRDKARAGCITLRGRSIPTPLFMPVGTYAAVKTLSPEELETLGAEIILSNAYHLYLRPGDQTVRSLGGIHRFTGWNRGFLTDSGGFQIFSLAPLRKVTEDGIRFSSHLDGSGHFLSPEDVVRIQTNIGADIIMPLDICTAVPTGRGDAESAARTTAEWASRSKREWERSGGEQALFGIVQGNVYRDLREYSARRTTDMDFPGYALGGLSVGEEKQLMYDIVDFTTDLLPESRPRYLMGVGGPDDILEAVLRGIDMFDCVLPTRNARNGTVFVPGGKLLIRNAEHRVDENPIQKDCGCYTCGHFSRGYLRHLFKTREILGYRLATIHNLHYLLTFVRKLRDAIRRDTIDLFKEQFERGAL